MQVPLGNSDAAVSRNGHDCKGLNARLTEPCWITPRLPRGGQRDLIRADRQIGNLEGAVMPCDSHALKACVRAQDLNLNARDNRSTGISDGSRKAANKILTGHEGQRDCEAENYQNSATEIGTVCRFTRLMCHSLTGHRTFRTA